METPQYTIYNTQVKITNQEQASRFKEYCTLSKLPVWVSYSAFRLPLGKGHGFFKFDGKDFWISVYGQPSLKTVDEPQFLELLAAHNLNKK